MKRMALVALAAIVVGCMPLAEQPALGKVPLSVLPSGPRDIAGIEAMLDWIETHPLAVGDDDTPDKPCTMAGPPMCLDVYQGLDWCRNACGDAYWHLEYTNTCIEVMTGEVISCP